MAKILYSATGADGQAVDGFVDAAGVVEARAQLLAQGLRDVRFHQEALAGTDESALKGLSKKQAAELARMMVRIRGNPSAATLLVETARNNRTWLLIDVVLLAALVWAERWWTALVILLIGLLPFAFALYGARRLGQYNALLKSDAVGTWDQSAALIAALRPAAETNVQLALDLDVRAAGARVRQGEPLATVLPALEEWRARLAATPGLYDSRVAGVHAAAGDRGGFVAAMRAAWEASGHDPARAADLALAEARWGSADEAEALLRGIDTTLLPVHAMPFLQWTRGAIAQSRGAPDALPLLTEAVTGFLKLSEKQPAAWTALAFAAADQALALQAAGRSDDARRTLQQVWPILKAHADAPLLNVLRREVLAGVGTE